MDKFTAAYLRCALWASTDDNGEPLDKKYTTNDILAQAKREAVEDCQRFQTENTELLVEIDAEQAGHDFFLTRNRHGAGFWDRELGEVGQKLTNAAHSHGEWNLYVGDDGVIYGV